MKKKVILFHLTPRMWMLHYASQFANALSKKVDLQIVIASYYEDSLFDNPSIFYKIQTNPSFASFLYDSILIWNHIKLMIFIIRNKPDIIHFIDNHPWYIIYAPLFALFGKKIYVTQHDPTLHSWEVKTFQGKIAAFTNKILRNTADKVIVHWEHLKSELVESYGISTNKIISVPHGNFNFLAKDFLRKKIDTHNVIYTFLFFWRIIEYKWLDILLLAFKKINTSYSNVQLLVVWSWNLSPYSSYLNWVKNITIVNESVPTEVIWEYFIQSDCVVLPYRDATGSWIIPLAYAFEKPVIVTDVGEFSNIIKESWWWICTAQNTVDGLIESMIYAIENKNNMISFWKNGRKYTEEVLGWDTIVAKVYEI